MTHEDKARAHLEKSLAAKNVELKTASLALGRNHAYLQQYIQRHKPRYLSERDREGLVTLYGIDGDPLKPPPVELRPTPKRVERTLVGDTQGDGEFVHDLEKLKLLAIWDELDDRTKTALMTLALACVRARPKVA